MLILTVGPLAGCLISLGSEKQAGLKIGIGVNY